MSDETADAVALCRATVRDVVHLVRLNLLRDHERRTLLDALDAVPRSEAEHCHACDGDGDAEDPCGECGRGYEQ